MPTSPDVEADLEKIREQARQYLLPDAVKPETRPEMLSPGGMLQRARKLVRKNFYYADADGIPLNLPLEDFYVVWFSKTLQNWKALVSTNVQDNMYYEVTHNGDKGETYIDQYHKVVNVCVKSGELDADD
jgi:hypothetical protein